jgi:ABC-type nitrate/sulfonate/bicarbonate transport system substrate-binding protein
MKRDKKRFFAVFMTIVLALTLGGCKSPKKEAAGGDTGLKSLVIRSSSGTAVAYDNQFHIAYLKGFFEEEFATDNITVDLIPLGNGPAMNEAMIAGVIDIEHGIGDQPMITGIIGGTNAKALATLSRQTSTQGIYVAADSPIRTVEELRGKAVAVSVGTFTHKCVIGILEDYGIQEEDIELVNLTSINEDIAALEVGDIVGFAGNFSSVYNHVNQGRIRQLVDFENHPAYTFLVVSNNFTSKYPEEA